MARIKRSSDTDNRANRHASARLTSPVTSAAQQAVEAGGRASS
jgi:hypothetical protein